MCFHPVTMVFEDGNKPNRIYPEIQGEAFSLDDILLANFIPTSAVMFRNGVFGDFPEWYHSFKIAEDWSLYVLLAQRGKLGFLKEPMGVYRFHSNSTWSMQDEVTRCKENITFYRCMKQHLGGSHGKIIDDMLDKQFFRIASLYEENDNHEMAKAYVRKAFSRPFSSRTRLIDKIKMAIRLYLPSWYRFMKGRA